MKKGAPAPTSTESPITFARPVPPPPPPSAPPSLVAAARPVPAPAVVQRELPHATSAPAAANATPIKTYAGDFTERMGTMKASTATVLAAEQDAGPRAVQTQSEKTSRAGLLYAIAGGVLIIIAGVGAYMAYVRFVAPAAPVILAPTITAPIFVDERQSVSGSGTALTQTLMQSVARSIAQGSIRLLYLDSATTTNMSVFSALQLPAPGALLRNIDAAQSMAGVANVNGAQSLFFILSVTSYSDTFAAMLAWEPRMMRDLIRLFPPYAVQTVSVPVATSTAMLATTSPQTPAAAAAVTPAAPYASGFSDETIANHDVRAYRDTSGRDVFLYGYWNQTTLVIAHDAAAFTEILKRLATSRTP